MKNVSFAILDMNSELFLIRINDYDCGVLQSGATTNDLGYGTIITWAIPPAFMSMTANDCVTISLDEKRKP
jgi:hypothetical protein